jgi:hypothetical protein
LNCLPGIFSKRLRPEKRAKMGLKVGNKVGIHKMAIKKGPAKKC